MPVHALIVAAGRGRRAGGETPKQYQTLGGVPVLRRTLRAFLDHPQVDTVQAVIHPDDAALYRDAVAGLDLPEPVHGGAERQDSVRAGLDALGERGLVLIHDAARPLIDAATIGRVIAALDTHDGALPVLPVADALLRADGELYGGPVPRDGLARAQTPQGFHLHAIRAAHAAAAGDKAADDAELAARHGLKVALVRGSVRNMKITGPHDFAEAEHWLMAALPDIRVGTGFDVHAFAPGDHVMLCGVRIDHEAGLAGHSDADAGLHALTDAILGAIGAEDIGAHFSPADPRWRGASSDQFLRHAASLVAARGGSIAHADVTVICERPKVGPHRTAMRERIADILSIDADRVSVKATTTEGLGFTGRREGIAAQASATIRLPC